MIYEYSQFANEQQLFSFIKDNFIEDLISSDNPTSRYDCYSSYFKSHIELKCRRKHYNELIIEKGKYDAMIKRCNDEGTIPIYINSTPKGVWAFYLYELEDKIEWEYRDLPKQTDFSKRETVSKEVGYLNIKDGKDLVLFLNESSPSF
jgi:hypothetical protein